MPANAATDSGVTPASVPPTTHAATSPRSTIRMPAPTACAPAAQAETVP